MAFTSGNLTVLDETDVVGSLSEALTAHVNTVLSDQTGVRRADAALSGAFTKLSGVGVPNGFVSHIAELKLVFFWVRLWWRVME